MADAQVPWNVAAPAGTITEASWRTKPSWYLVTTEDRRRGPVDTTRRRNHGPFGKDKRSLAERSVVPRPETWLLPQPLTD